MTMKINGYADMAKAIKDSSTGVRFHTYKWERFYCLFSPEFPAIIMTAFFIPLNYIELSRKNGS